MESIIRHLSLLEDLLPSSGQCFCLSSVIAVWFTAVLHSRFSGHYAFIESSSPNLSGDFAQLLSPIFTGYQNRCLEFFYHMYGSDSGDLTVYRRVEDFSLETVFAETDNKGDVWRKGLVRVAVSSVAGC